MLSDFISIDKTLKTPLYIQIYSEIKNAVESGNIKEAERIPSVRKLCADLNVSKTTIENAYGLLCSYIEKGLYISKTKSRKTDNTNKSKVYKYDFSGKGIDKNCTNIKEWRKYVKDILNKEYLLNTYSEAQGEQALREAISEYAFTTRGVSADYTNIIIV